MHMARLRITNLPYKTEIQTVSLYLRPERTFNPGTVKVSGVLGAICGVAVAQAAGNPLIGGVSGLAVAGATSWLFGREDQHLFTQLPFGLIGPEIVPSETDQTFVTSNEVAAPGEKSSGLIEKMIRLSKVKTLTDKSTDQPFVAPFLLVDAKLEGIPHQLYDLTLTGLRPHPPQWLRGVRVTGVRVIEITDSDRITERNFATAGVSIDDVK